MNAKTITVPRDPTPEMVAAGMEHVKRLVEMDDDEVMGTRDEYYRAKGCVLCIWMDMLAALSPNDELQVPEPPPPADVGGSELFVRPMPPNKY